jgi:FtsX-like permease family
VLPFAVGVGGQLAAVPLRSVLSDETLDRLTPICVLSTLVGFVTIGPWLCMFAGQGLARVSRRVPGLIAARRLASDPRGTFRAVSGVVVAAFAVSYGAALVDPGGGEPPETEPGVPRPGVVEVLTSGVPARAVAPLLTEGSVAIVDAPGGPAGALVDACPALARVTTQRCRPADAEVAIVDGDGLDGAGPGLTTFRIYVPTEGGAAAERVRTRAVALVPNALVHMQRDRVDHDLTGVRSLGQLMRVFWMFVLVVAACSLTVGTLAAMIERRRPFALLRASGLRLSELRRVVILETAAAMLITALVGVALGLASSYALSVFRDIPWTWPDASVFATVAAGVLVALALTLLALPLVEAATRHEAVRFE